MLRCDALVDLGVRHGFFTREGGVSEGLYASLNCGFGSDDGNGEVAENRRLAMRALGAAPDSLTTVRQVHSAVCAPVVKPWPPEEAPEADAMAASTPGVTLGVLTADCAPVLFADPAARVIGAAHAGWKGALAGVLEATLSSMEALGAARRRVVACVGPCIAQESYEVGPEFVERFQREGDAADRFFRPAPRAGRFLFDLPGYVGNRLGRAGVQAHILGRDTLAEDGLFYSYRRSTLRGESDYGRQLSAIALDPA